MITSIIIFSIIYFCLRSLSGSKPNWIDYMMTGFDSQLHEMNKKDYERYERNRIRNLKRLNK